jgi:hypothetical protein
VLKSTLEIDRTERLNKSLFPKGEVYVLNDEKHNLQDVLNLQQQVRDHEYWHTQLAKEEFEKVRKEKADPAVKIEKIIKPAKQDLVKEADQEIRGIDARIATAADEGKVKDKLKAIPKYQRDCSIWLYKGDPENKISVKRPLGKLWSLGDDLQDAGN